MTQDASVDAPVRHRRHWAIVYRQPQTSLLTCLHVGIFPPARRFICNGFVTMSLPPQKINIKRKRGESPPSSLRKPLQDCSGNAQLTMDEVIERGSKRYATSGGYVFRRQAALDSDPSARTPIHSEQRRTPLQPAGTLGEETRSQVPVNPAPVTPSDHAQTTPIDSAQQSTVKPSPRFYEFSHRPSQSHSGPSGAQLGTENLAMFVESSRQRELYDALVSDRMEGTSTGGVPRKKPGVRDKVGPDSRQIKNQAGLDRKAELLMQEMAADYLTKSESETVDGEAVDSETREDSASDGAGATGADDEQDDDYVIETYIRQPNGQGDGGMLLVSGSSDVGFLVIRDEDEDQWVTYADQEENDEYDVDHDSDDENAEDYYGADYPEEELDEDDEFNRNPYQYRNNGASDDEEFGPDDPWSDDTPNRHPWGPWYDRMMRNDNTLEVLDGDDDADDDDDEENDEDEDD